MKPDGTGVRAFNSSGYEVLDEDLMTCGEVVIWSVDPLVPRLGDRFTVENDGVIHDIAVIQLTLFPGGWSAVTRVVESY